MAATDKDFELDGHTLPSEALVAETTRLLDLARTHAMAMRPQGYDVKHITEMEQLKDMVLKEHNRVEVKPPKPREFTKEQEKLMARCYQWRAMMVRKADRAFPDNRYDRLRYHRGFQLHRLPERMYEELYWLVQYARQDIRKLQAALVDEAFISQGEDLCFELQGMPVPNRKAQEEYEKALKEHMWGPPPTPPAPLPKLPQPGDTAKALSILKGRLWLQLRMLSASGQVAFCTPTEKEAARAEGIRREWLLRLRPQEDDEEFFVFGKLGGAPEKPGNAPAAPGTTPNATPAAPAPTTTATAPAPEPARVTPMEQVTSKPGGPNPAPPADPFKKPPPRAVGLVRPSPTHGTKKES